mmetsp:Transcript_70695/g.197543  ORF Transcript_70695/g.197543 Transcript_70695/m.197543 type:complete len:249 (-) Transcript_70695:779-1525(-)
MISFEEENEDLLGSHKSPYFWEEPDPWYYQLRDVIYEDCVFAYSQTRDTILDFSGDQAYYKLAWYLRSVQHRKFTFHSLIGRPFARAAPRRTAPRHAASRVSHRVTHLPCSPLLSRPLGLVRRYNPVYWAAFAVCSTSLFVGKRAHDFLHQGERVRLDEVCAQPPPSFVPHAFCFVPRVTCSGLWLHRDARTSFPPNTTAATTTSTTRHHHHHQTPPPPSPPPPFSPFSPFLPLPPPPSPLPAPCTQP